MYEKFEKSFQKRMAFGGHIRNGIRKDTKQGSHLSEEQKVTSTVAERSLLGSRNCVIREKLKETEKSSERKL